MTELENERARVEEGTAMQNSEIVSEQDLQDELLFQDEEENLIEEGKLASEADRPPALKSWKILIVDDDVEVHNVTKLALRDFLFENKPLSFISAYSAQQAKQLIQAHPDIAIAFVDVVMETEDAGLQLVQYIREELGNQLIRIIIRTGQPGRAPEDLVVVDYGIDDYKTKTELTSKKLFITVVTALRSFSTLIRMFEQSIQGLQTTQPTFATPEKIEALSHLIIGLARSNDGANQVDAFQSMSVVTRIARMVLRATDEHCAKLGISQTKLAVLVYLSGEPEQYASPSALAKHCGVTRAAMTGLLDSLEQEGYVERDPDPTDRRALIVRLTATGQQFLDWVVPQDQYEFTELMTALEEPERKKLAELALRAVQLMESDDRVD